MYDVYHMDCYVRLNLHAMCIRVHRLTLAGILMYIVRGTHPLTDAVQVVTYTYYRELGNVIRLCFFGSRTALSHPGKITLRGRYSRFRFSLFTCRSHTLHLRGYINTFLLIHCPGNVYFTLCTFPAKSIVVV